jgi:hypothetical protein
MAQTAQVLEECFRIPAGDMSGTFLTRAVRYLTIWTCMALVVSKFKVSGVAPATIDIAILVFRGASQ